MSISIHSAKKAFAATAAALVFEGVPDTAAPVGGTGEPRKVGARSLGAYAAAV